MELFAGGGWLALRLVAPGWFWTRSADDSSPDGKIDAFLRRLGRAVAVGLLLNLLPALGLSALGIWTPVADVAVWTAIVLAGIGTHLARKTTPAPAAGLAALAAVWLATSLPLFFAPRSEWLAGGWDPGLYQNNAVVIARQNGLQDRAGTVYSSMSPEDRTLFTRSDGDYHEILPSVPLRVEDATLPLYFFHLTPVCGAWFLRTGGTALLFRLPAILALWGLFPALALLIRFGFGGGRKWAALVPWGLSPLWWYHQAIPTAEMLYLLLMLSGLLLYLGAARRGAAVPLGALAAIFAGIANHLNAVVPVAVFLPLAAAAEADRRAPRRVVRILSAYVAAGAALVWNLRFAGITILRLEDKDQALRVLLPALIASAVLALLLVWRPPPSAFRRGALRLAAAFGAAAGLGLAIVGLGAGLEPVRAFLLQTAARLPGVGGALDGLVRVVPFHGPMACAWAGAGLAGLALCREPDVRPLKGPVAALGIVCLLLFLQPGIAPLYPWALRRHVVFLVPLLAWTQAFAAVRASAAVRSRGGGWRWALLLVFLLPLAEQGRLVAAAARVGDYRGLERALAEVERALRPGDVVVADDPEWGTPLALAGGHDVVSGRRLWRSDDPAYQRRYLETLARVRRDTGRRFLWLTSTGDGLGLYPAELGSAPAPLADVDYEFRVVNHGARARSYETKPRQRLFRLYEWDGSFRLRNDPPAP